MSSNEENGMPKVSTLERKWLIPTLLGLFICSTIYFLEGENAEIVPQDVTFKNVTTSDLVPTSSQSAVPKPDPPKKVRGNSPKVKDKVTKSKARPVDLETMLESFEAKRQELYKQLELDYGPETFKKLLLNHGRTAIGAPSSSEKKESTERMKRKIMLKILEGQAATTKQSSRNLQLGDGSKITSHDESRRMQDADLAGAPTYVWATGGHRYVVF
jgi:type IV secretory pathway VirB10-like protein